jgi:hypothetical protein
MLFGFRFITLSYYQAIEDQREVGTKIRTLDAPNRPLRHSVSQFYETPRLKNDRQE